MFIYGKAPSLKMPLHGLIGLIVMTLGVLQPLNAVVRPHGEGAMRTTWEMMHKNIGRSAIVFGLLNCTFGAMVASDQHNGDKYMQLLSLVTLGSLVFFLVAYAAGKVWASTHMPP